MPFEIDDSAYEGKSTPETEKLWAALCEVNDPELHMNIVSLGLVYDVKKDGEAVTVDMTLTSPACPYGPQLLYAVDHACKTVDGIEKVDIELVWDPPWGPEKMSEEAKLELGFDI